MDWLTHEAAVRNALQAGGWRGMSLPPMDAPMVPRWDGRALAGCPVRWGLVKLSANFPTLLELVLEPVPH